MSLQYTVPIKALLDQLAPMVIADSISVQDFLSIYLSVKPVTVLLDYPEEYLVQRYNRAAQLSTKAGGSIGFSIARETLNQLAEEYAHELLHDSIPRYLHQLSKYTEMGQITWNTWVQILKNSTKGTGINRQKTDETGEYGNHNNTKNLSQFQRYMAYKFFGKKLLGSAKVASIRALLQSMDVQSLTRINPSEAVQQQIQSQALSPTDSDRRNSLNWTGLVKIMQLILPQKHQQDFKSKLVEAAQVYFKEKHKKGANSPQAKTSADLDTKYGRHDTVASIDSILTSPGPKRWSDRQLQNTQEQPTHSEIYEDQIQRLNDQLNQAHNQVYKLTELLEKSKSETSVFFSNCQQYAHELTRLQNEIRRLNDQIKQCNQDKQLQQFARNRLVEEFETQLKTHVEDKKIYLNKITALEESNSCLILEVNNLRSNFRQQPDTRSCRSPSSISVNSYNQDTAIRPTRNNDPISTVSLTPSFVPDLVHRQSLKSEVGSNIYNQLEVGNFGQEPTSAFFQKASRQWNLDQQIDTPYHPTGPTGSSLSATNSRMPSPKHVASSVVACAIQFYKCSALDLTNFHNPVYREISVSKKLLLITQESIGDKSKIVASASLTQTQVSIVLVKQNPNWMLLRLPKEEFLLQMFDRDYFIQAICTLSAIVKIERNTPLSRLFLKRSKNSRPETIKGDHLPKQVLSATRWALAGCIYSGYIFLREQTTFKEKFRPYHGVLCVPFILLYEDVDLLELRHAIPVLAESTLHRRNQDKCLDNEIYEVTLSYKGIANKQVVLGFRSKLARDSWCMHIEETLIKQILQKRTPTRTV